MNKIQALHEFWSSFGLNAYDAMSVSDDAVLPYLTYEVSSSDFGKTLAQTTNLWYRSSSWKEITEKEMQIADFISRGGRTVSYDDGVFWIKKGNPWAQRLADENDDTIRRIVLNVEVEFID